MQYFLWFPSIHKPVIDRFFFSKLQLHRINNAIVIVWCYLAICIPSIKEIVTTCSIIKVTTCIIIVIITPFIVRPLRGSTSIHNGCDFFCCCRPIHMCCGWVGSCCCCGFRPIVMGCGWCFGFCCGWGNGRWIDRAFFQTKVWPIGVIKSLKICIWTASPLICSLKTNDDSWLNLFWKLTGKCLPIWIWF